MDDDLEEELVQTDITILQELLKADEDPESIGLTQDELMDATGRSRSNISERISFLEGRDLLEWSIPWGRQKRHYQLKHPERFDPYQDSHIPVSLLE